MLLGKKPPAPYEAGVGPLPAAIHRGLEDGSVRGGVNLANLYHNTNDSLLVLIQKLAIGGWMQIGAKDWFEEDFFDEKFDRFVTWTKGRNVHSVYAHQYRTDRGMYHPHDAKRRRGLHPRPLRRSGALIPEV